MAEEILNLVRDSTVKQTNEILSQMVHSIKLDGTAEGYKKAMRQWFIENGSYTATPKDLTELCNKWYTLTREPWCGGVKFSKTTAVSTGEKFGDNKSLECTASTDKIAGKDDYAGLPLFACVDCNFTMDPDTKEPLITAIAGISDNFQRHSPEHFVGVLQMSGYFCTTEDDDSYIEVYSSTVDVPYENIEPLNEAIRPNNETRPWVVHAKYPSFTVEGKLTSYAGAIATGYSISHNSLNTILKTMGNGWAAETSADDAFLKIMLHIKYASLASDGIIQGCCANNHLADAKTGEENTKRIIVSKVDGANFEVGMGILVGTNASTDRQVASSYTISTQTGLVITSIESIMVAEEECVAIYTNSANDFTTTQGDGAGNSTRIFTYHWANGSTDGVLGNDGSKGNNTSGKYPGKIQGIEFMTGGWEVVGDTILKTYQDEADQSYWYEPYVCKDTSKYSITDDYKPSGVKLKQPSAINWYYIKHLTYKKGVFFPTDIQNGSSTTYTEDAFYALANNATNVYEWLLRGVLGNGVARSGLSCGLGDIALSFANWRIVARVSPNGNRGEWSATK